MAGSTPKSDSAQPQHETYNRNSDLKVDDIIENSIGEFGGAQFFQTVLVSLAYMFDSQQVFISVFTDAVPTWHCTKNSTACTSTSNICELSKTEWSWDVHSDKTIVSEWDLQCASSLITGLPASSFCLGCVIGVLALSMLADSFLGRKKFLLLSCLTMSLSAFSTTFSTNIWMYSALRFFSGFGRASIGTCIIVLLTETVGKGCRGRVIFVAFFCFALGFLSLPAIAYITKDSSWRRMYLYTSLPVLIYSLFLYFFVYESPRWLFLQGRNEEAVAVLKKLSSATRCDYLEHIMSSGNISLKQEKVKDDYFTSLKKLFEKGWACRRILIIMGLGCSLGLVYYGIPLGLGNLGFNLYLSVTFNAIIEVPSALILLFFVDRWNRRSSILTLFLASGISCSICAITGSKWEGVKIVFELLAFFCVCASCDFLAVFTVELFPTSVRNLATSLSRQSHVFGAVFSPMLISEGRKSKFFPYGVFGIVMIISGVLLCLLPETRGAKLCDTMDEQESKETDHVV